MKRFVNGEAVELSNGDAVIVHSNDRLIVKTDDGAYSAAAVRVGDTVHVSYRGKTYLVEKATRPRGAGGAGSGELRAPMPGLIVDVLLEPGVQVIKGDKILVLEAMKTQQPFLAPFDGTLTEVKVTKGEQVGEGALLALVTANES
jgi:biotin carboxyl carrier protein